MKTSWRTTLSGIAAILITIGEGINAAISGGDLNVGQAIAAIMAGIGLISARDNNKTSEDVGVK
jgi:hypothetical protein